MNRRGFLVAGVAAAVAAAVVGLVSEMPNPCREIDLRRTTASELNVYLREFLANGCDVQPSLVGLEFVGMEIDGDETIHLPASLPHVLIKNCRITMRPGVDVAIQFHPSANPRGVSLIGNTVITASHPFVLVG